MSDSGNRFVTNLMKDAAQLLGTAKQIAPFKDDTLRATEIIPDKLLREELESLHIPINLNLNGSVEIRLSDDEMIAYADFFPPSGKGEPINASQFHEKLSDRNITCGVDGDRIKELIFKCNTERKEIQNQIIARGKSPVCQVPAHIELTAKFNNKTLAGDCFSDGGKIDYKKTNYLVLVKKGETIANQIPKTTGVMGQTVTNKAIPYTTSAVPKWKPGENTEVENLRVVAACDGRFVTSRNVFAVREVLEIYSDIDYSTGNLNYPKDVVLHGSVQDGFKLDIGGSLVCKKTLTATEVSCRENLSVSGGIVGRNRGIVTVEGSIRTNFIENSHVEAKDGIYVKKSILNSFVYSQGEITLGNKGQILGGKIYAGQGLQAYQIGSERSPKTEIVTGIDFIAQRNLFEIKDKTFELVRLLSRLNKAKDKYPDNISIPTTINKVQDTLRHLREQAATLLQALNKNECAEVKIFGMVCAGVSIEICNVVYIVTKRMDSVVFRLDKTKGRIVAEKRKLNG